MNRVQVITTLLIMAGMVVMIVNIVKSRVVFRMLQNVSTNDAEKVKWFFIVHEVLMFLFVLGYATLAYTVLMQVNLASELFVGIIFFFGAIFVLIGILLNSTMISAIKKRYDQVVTTGNLLRDERKNLKKANLDLTQEIDERRQAEKALQASRDFLQNLIDIFPEQIMVVNRDYSIALANAKVRQNVPPGTPVEGLPCYKIPDHSETPCSDRGHACPLNEILRLHRPVTMEHVQRDSHGNEMFVEIVAAPIFDEDGNITQILEVCHDITERKRSAEALKESKERYKRLSEVTIEGICFHNQGVLIDANGAFFKMFGYTLSDLIGKNAIDLIIVPEDRHSVINKVAAGDIRPYEVMAQRKDGSTFPVEIEGRNTRYQNKSVRVSAFRDISERRRSEEKLSQVQKMEAIGTLAGGIAHDFNNILSAIMGYTEILKMETGEGNPAEEKLNRILQASHRARDLIHQILAFSRQKEEELQPVQVSLIAREALKLLRASIPTTIEFHTEIENNSGAVMADPTRIHQILMNLCTNASHAMLEKGGTLTIRIESRTLDAESAKHNPDLHSGPYILLVVADTGQGMDQETLQRIFEPYFTTKEPGIGTGLGLSAVHGIVKRAGGAIDVFSKPGEGATFKLYFPMMENDIKMIAEDPAAPQYGNEKILLVDDDEIVIEMTREMLKTFGYAVDSKMSSLDALNTFRRYPEEYDLVVTDLTMPHLPGDQLVEKLKKIRPDIPVVLCTGFSETLSEEKIARLGINGFLMKPIVMRDLSNTIRDVLDKTRHPQSPGSNNLN